MLLVCMSAAYAPPTASMERACGCGELVWVSHAMIPEVDAMRLTPVCPTCAQRQIGDEELAIHPHQVPDLQQAGLHEMAQGLEGLSARDVVRFLTAWRTQQRPGSGFTP